MRVRGRAAALVAVGLGLGGVGGFLGGLWQDRSHGGAGWVSPRLSLSEDRSLLTAEPKGVVHGTQARTAHAGHPR